MALRPMHRKYVLAQHQSFSVRTRGLEPPRDCSHKNLNLTRIPNSATSAQLKFWCGVNVPLPIGRQEFHHEGTTIAKIIFSPSLRPLIFLPLSRPFLLTFLLPPASLLLSLYNPRYLYTSSGFV